MDEIEIDEEQVQQDSRDFAKMRKRAETAEADRDALRTQLLDNAITTAGFDPNLGIVKRLAKEFDGDLTADAFKAFAVAEGLAPAASTLGDEKDATTRTETEQQLDKLQGQGDRLRQLSTVPEPASDNAEKAKLLQEGSIGQLLDREIFTPKSA